MRALKQMEDTLNTHFEHYYLFMFDVISAYMWSYFDIIVSSIKLLLYQTVENEVKI